MALAIDLIPSDIEADTRRLDSHGSGSDCTCTAASRYVVPIALPAVRSGCGGSTLQCKEYKDIEGRRCDHDAEEEGCAEKTGRSSQAAA
jgi:hypothetical protein